MLPYFSTSDSRWVARNLQSNSEHKFCISTIYCSILPENETCISLYTLSDAVSNLSLKIEMNSIAAEWKPIIGVLWYYAILVRTDEDYARNEPESMELQTNQSKATFENLEPETNYSLTIFAENQAGNGSSYIRRVQTKPVRPPIFEWWWIVLGCLLLIMIPGGLAIAHCCQRKHLWCYELPITEESQRRERIDGNTNVDRCCSCWSVVFRVQQTEQEQKRDKTDENVNADRCCSCWRAVYSVQGTEAKHRQEKPQENINADRCCSCWSAIYRVQETEAKHRRGKTDENINTDRCCSCWSAVFRVQETKEKHRRETIDDNINIDQCCSCWSAVFTVQQADNTSNAPHMEESEDNYRDNSLCCPWRAVFDVHERTRNYPSNAANSDLSLSQEGERKSNTDHEENSLENESEVVQDNKKSSCCPWTRTFWVNQEENISEQKQQDDDDEYDTTAHTPSKSCWPWKAVFWVNREK